MKVEVNEYEGCFAIDLEPENLEDAVFLIRMGMNATKEIRTIACYVSTSCISGSVVLAKRKNDSSLIPKIK
jgi:hypothetical protein